jgi:alanyl aminopeptidase
VIGRGRGVRQGNPTGSGLAARRARVPRAVFAAILLAACAPRTPEHGAAPGVSDRPGASGAAGSPGADGAASRPDPAERPPVLRLPRTAVPRRQSVDLTVIPDQDRFTGEVVIDVELLQPTRLLWLNGKQLEVREASIEAGGEAGGARAPAEPVLAGGEFLGLRLARPVGPGPAIVRIAFRGALVDDDYAGLFRQREAGLAYVFAQFEIAEARRAFPCFDEPNYKIPWQITVRVAKDHVAIANSPVARESPGPGEDMKTIEFRPTQPLPSYLIAIAVGPFDVVKAGTAGKKRVPLAFAVPRGRGAETRAARRSTREFLVVLERFFGMPYPYEKLDSISVPHLFGAMENAAHITYASSILLARPDEERTPSFQRRHRSIVAHEVAHQWFGDLVTMAWWDDLWLNESFATWLEEKLTRDLRSQAEPAAGVGDREGAMRADARPGTRAIHRTIDHRDDFLFIFDPINYGKGAAVIAMFEAWVGEDRFRAGIQRYLARHAHGNATTADFLAAVDEAAPGRGVAEAFATFVDQPGVPLVHVDLRCQPGAKPTLLLRQKRLVQGRASRTQRWKIPVCVDHGAGGRTHRQCTLLDKESAEVELDSATCPAWVHGNADAIGYYRVGYGGDLLERILSGRARVSDRERASALDDAVALADAGELSYAALIAALPALARARDVAILRRAALMAASLEVLVPPERKADYARLVRDLFGPRARALGWKPRPGESAAARIARPDVLGLVAVQGQDPALASTAERLARAWLRTPSSLPPDAVAPVLAAAAAARGSADLHAAYVERLLKEKVAERRAALLIGLTRFRDPAIVARTVDLAASPAVAFNEMEELLAGDQADPALAETIYGEMVASFNELVGKLGADRRVLLLGIAEKLCSAEQRDRADRFFADRLAGAPGIATARARMRESIDLCAARRAAQSSAVGGALEGK